MNDWLKLVQNANRLGFSPSILLLAIILMWGGKIVESYTNVMMERVKQIHETQLLDMANNQKYQDKTNEKLIIMDSRLIAIETQNHLLGMPLYQEEGKTYFQQELYGK